MPYKDRTNQTRKITHDPISIKDKDITVAIKSDGKVEIEQDGLDGKYDKVIVSAKLVYKIANLLENTRKIVWVDRSAVKE